VLVVFGTLFVSGLALLPALLVIVLAEAFAIRTVIYYALAGAAVAAFLYLSFRGFDTLALRVNGFARRELEIMAAAGIFAGFVYWIIAGRNAGAWRRPGSRGI
jgi:zinc transporter ZupT